MRWFFMSPEDFKVVEMVVVSGRVTSSRPGGRLGGQGGRRDIFSLRPCL